MASLRFRGCVVASILLFLLFQGHYLAECSFVEGSCSSDSALPESPGACRVEAVEFQSSTQQWDEKPAYACNPAVNAVAAALPFCNTSLTIRARVDDLLARLTVQEKIAQLVNTAPEISSLGIPKHEWWQEALHGLAQSPGVAFGGQIPSATVFPQVILTAASFNATLWHEIAKVRRICLGSCQDCVWISPRRSLTSAFPFFKFPEESCWYAALLGPYLSCACL